LLDNAEWSGLIRSFYAEHAPTHPLFHELGSEFVRFLGEHPEHYPTRPFLHELAHYEWVELALELDAADAAAIAVDRNGDLIDDVPVASPLAWVLGYRYPVQLIRGDYQPSAPPPEPTWLLVYRNLADKVQFQGLQPLSAQLLASIQENPTWTGRAHLQALAAAAGMSDLDALLLQARPLLQGWLERDVLLGTQAR
jgi:hypothetical protein